MANKIQVELHVDDKGSQKIKSFASSSKSQLDALKNTAMAAAAALTAMVASAVAGVTALNKIIDAADKIAKSADAIGITTRAYQEYTAAAAMSSVSSDSLSMSMRYMTNVIGDAAAGADTLKTALGETNKELYYQLLASRDADEQFTRSLKAIKDAPSSLNKLRLAYTLFGGRAGQAMVNLADSLDSNIALARKYGLVIDEHLLRGAEEASTAITMLSDKIKVTLYNSILQLLPSVENIVKHMLDWIQVNEALIKQKLDNTLTTIGNVLIIIRNNITLLTAAAKALASIVGGILIASLVKYMLSLAAWASAIKTDIQLLNQQRLAINTMTANIANIAKATNATAAVVVKQTGAMAFAMRAAGNVARTMWAAIGGPVGLIAILASVLLYFVDLQAVTSNIKSKWDAITGMLRQYKYGTSDIQIQVDLQTIAVDQAKAKLLELEQRYKTLGSNTPTTLPRAIDMQRQTVAKLAKDLDKLNAKLPTTQPVDMSKIKTDDIFADAVRSGYGSVPLDYYTKLQAGIISARKQMLDDIAKLEAEANNDQLTLLRLREAAELKEIDDKFRALSEKYNHEIDFTRQAELEKLLIIKTYADKRKDVLASIEAAVDAHLVDYFTDLDRREQAENTSYDRSIMAMQNMSVALAESRGDYMEADLLALKNWYNNQYQLLRNHYGALQILNKLYAVERARIMQDELLWEYDKAVAHNDAVRRVEVEMLRLTGKHRAADAVELQAWYDEQLDIIKGHKDAELKLLKLYSRKQVELLQLGYVSVGDVADSISYGIGSAMDRLIDGTIGFKRAFREMTASVLKDIAAIIAKQLMLNAVSSMFSFVGGYYNSAYISGIGEALQGRAVGGPVSSNTPYIVGERGPELFVPSGNGNIIPNSKLTNNKPINITLVDERTKVTRSDGEIVMVVSDNIARNGIIRKVIQGAV